MIRLPPHKPHFRIPLRRYGLVIELGNRPFFAPLYMAIRRF
jgi:hypothetical protein